ncbi:hypothetical protein HKX48_006895 [Thoreauomyces humboldtii]|nr:hypothetical protein HKX48_006895 [Thoreauomyces humboldtii]
MADNTTALTSRPQLPDSVLWSDENQIAIVTPPSIHIVTPTHSLPIRTSITPPRRDNPLVRDLPLVADEDVRAVHVWKNGFRHAVWSPTTCSSLHGCLLATVSLLFSVLVWQPTADPANSEWDIVLDLSDAFRTHVLECRDPDDPDDPTTSPLKLDELSRLSVLSIAWSPLAFAETLDRHFSLIALGSKDGVLTLWKFDPRTKTVAHVAQCVGSVSWVMNLAWSTWTTDADGTGTSAYMASACADGTLLVWNVAVTNDGMFSCTIEKVAELSKKDNRRISVLKFMQPSLTRDLPKRLAYGKGRKLTVWMEHSRREGEGNSLRYDTLALELPQVTSLAGIVWGLSGDELRVYGLHGQCLMIAIMAISDGTKTLIIEGDGTPDLERDIFQIPPGGITEEDGPPQNAGAADDDDGPVSTDKAMRPLIHGAATSANAIYDAVVYHAFADSDLVYLTEKHKVSSLVVRSVWGSRSGEEVEVELGSHVISGLKDPKLVRLFSPQYLMWDVVMYCVADFGQWPTMRDSFASRFLDSLRDFYITHDPGLPVRDVDGIQAAMLNLHQAMYHNSNMNALKLMNQLCRDLAAQAPPKSTLRPHVRDINVANLEALSLQYIQHVVPLIWVLLSTHPTITIHDGELKTIGLITDHVFLHLSDFSTGPVVPSLRAIHERLLAKHGLRLYHSGFDGTLARVVEVMDGGEEEDMADIVLGRERCMACGKGIRLQGLWRGVCEGGHGWDRCTVTLAVLGVVGLRSCGVCNVKIKIPTEPTSLHAFIDEKIEQCIYCGNHFQEPKKLLEDPADVEG